MPEKCFKCSDDIPIPSVTGDVLMYNGNKYHSNCLICEICKSSLGGLKFIRDAKRGLVCLKCEEEHGLKCLTCKQGFKPGQTYKRVSQPSNSNNNNDELCYHTDCFTCSLCSAVIPNEYYDRQGLQVCVDCHDKQELENRKICKKCNEVIKLKYVLYKDEPYHQECFQCCLCSKSIETTVFYRHDQDIEPVCTACHELTIKTCFKCSKPINDGVGVQFEDKSYHDRCLRCSECDDMLDGGTVLTSSSNKDEIYCEKCYLSKYAKICDGCNLSINPTISCALFDGKYFHKECFVCATCKQSIADTPFIKRDLNFICVNCK